LLLALSLLIVATTPLHAQPVNLAVAAKAASCNACHGPYGRSDAGIPPLAGRSADELYAALAGFKTGSRAAFVMHQHAKGYSDEELRDIAAEFSRQKPTRGRK
jgi:cytochrome c553